MKARDKDLNSCSMAHKKRKKKNCASNLCYTFNQLASNTKNICNTSSHLKQICFYGSLFARNKKKLSNTKKSLPI